MRIGGAQAPAAPRALLRRARASSRAGRASVWSNGIRGSQPVSARNFELSPISTSTSEGRRRAGSVSTSTSTVASADQHVEHARGW